MLGELLDMRVTPKSLITEFLSILEHIGSNRGSSIDAMTPCLSLVTFTQDKPRATDVLSTEQFLEANLFVKEQITSQQKL